MTPAWVPVTLALKNSQLAATDSFTTTRALTLAGNESIDVAATKILSWNGEISGAGTLVKEGQGTLLLRGTNQHDGGTTVNAGTLQISRDANLGRGALALNDGTLQSTGSFATSRAATLRGQATMEVDASHTVTWNGELRRRRHVAQVRPGHAGSGRRQHVLGWHGGRRPARFGQDTKTTWDGAQ